LAQALIVIRDSAILRCIILASMAEMIWVGRFTIGNLENKVHHPHTLTPSGVKQPAIHDKRF